MQNPMFLFLALLTALPSALASCLPITDVTLTFYGWPDNSPPGSDNAFDCGRGLNADGEPKAGGRYKQSLAKIRPVLLSRYS